MIHAQSARAVLIASLLLALAPSVRCQDAEYRRQAKALKESMKRGDPDARVSAGRAVQGSGVAEGVKLLLRCFGENEEEAAEVRAEFTKVGRLLHAEKAKITNVRLTRPQMNAAQAKIRPLERKLSGLDERIKDLQRVSAVFEKSVGELIKSTPAEQRKRAIQEVVKAYEWGKKPEDKARALKTMAWTDDPAIVTALMNAATLARNPGIRVAAFETMAILAKPEMTSAAIEALEDRFWQVRVAAVAVLKKTGGKEAIPPLIGALEHADGRMVDELIDTLKALTKVNYHDNVTLWRDWWAKNEGKFGGHGADAGVPGVVAKGDKQEQGGRGGTYFYGIRSRSKHIIYVLDISGSMRWALDTRYGRGRGGQPPDAPKGKSKLDNAVKELLQSITGLPDDGTFNVITYAIEHEAWKKKMQKASRPAKAAARKWANSLQADGATNIFDALERAFKLVGRGSFDARYGLAADTIFFLSDGQANSGRVVDPRSMLREIRSLNELKNVKIHCIGLGSSTDERFMRTLAEENGGQYVHIGPRRGGGAR